MSHSPKIVIIGAGGIAFPIRLITDILSFKELQSCTLALMDINATRLNRTAKLTDILIKKNGFATKLETTTDRRVALKGAKYVIIAFQVGGLEAYKIDKDIPRKYGIDLCVGDTLNSGGIFRGLRSIAAYTEIARDMLKLCPDALMINYANPMAINCWAVNNLGVKVVGLCHSVQGTSEMLTRLVSAKYEDVTFKCYGINHQAWFTEFREKGRDLYPRLREELFRRFPSPGEKRNKSAAAKAGSGLAVDHDNYYYDEPVRTEIMRTFGYFQTESPHHASEYLPWFRKNKETVDAYIKKRWDYYDFCVDLTYEKLRENVEAEMQKPIACSHEYGAPIIHSMETGQPCVIYGNVPNWGAPGAPRNSRAHLIPNLPQNCCVEVACLVDRNGIQPTVPGELPPQLAAINRTNINVQELTVLASQTGDRQMVEQALAMDPLTGALLTLPQIRSLTREMFTAQKRWLPQFSKK